MATRKIKMSTWQKKRLEIFDRDGWECKLCKDNESILNLYQTTNSIVKVEAKNKDIITLCEHCRDLVDIKSISFNDIMHVKKFKNPRPNTDEIGFVVSFSYGTGYYDLLNHNIREVVLFSKGSEILKSIYNLNNGK